MGVTAFFYAATGSVDRVEAVLRTSYPEELRGTVAEDRAAGSDALEQIYKNDDGTQVVLWQDGAFTCWAESEACMADDEDVLREISARLGTLLVAMIGDHGGSYAFGVFREGTLVRWLQNDWDLTGEPIAEEAGIDPATLSDDDVRQLWERFGLRPFEAGVPPFRALVAGRAARASTPAPPAKPWWKLW